MAGAKSLLAVGFWLLAIKTSISPLTVDRVTVDREPGVSTLFVMRFDGR